MMLRSLLMKRSSSKRKAILSPSRSIMDDDVDADADDEPSLFVVVSHAVLTEHSFSILQLEPPPHESSSQTHKIPTEFSVNFSKPLTKYPITWEFSPMVTSTKSQLYIVPDCYSKSDRRIPYTCAIFDLRSKTWTPIDPPHSPKYSAPLPKYSANVLTQGNHIYFLADPQQQRFLPSIHLCERYNTLKGSWKVLEPYPHYAVNVPVGHLGNIVATVVLDDTILLSIDGHQIWAYYIPKGHWYVVNVKNKLCYRMIGQTVVLKNSIYAIPTGKDEKVLELSLERRKINGGLVFTLDLRSEISVPGLKKNKLGVKLKHTMAWTSNFVHLGKDKFCLVWSCHLLPRSKYQSIQVTYIKLNGKYSTVTNRCVHKFKMPGNKQFEVRCCFSLPKSKTTMLEEGQRLFTVNLNTYETPKVGAGIETPKVGRPTLVACSSVRTQLYFGPKASTGDGDGAERNDTNEEGHSMCEKRFPPDITLRRFVEELNNYGPKGFRLMTDNVGNLSAYVKFESEARKRESYFPPDSTLGRFVEEVKKYGFDIFRLVMDNTGNFFAFESASYKRHIAKVDRFIDCSSDSDYSEPSSESATEESSEESDSDESSQESDSEESDSEESSEESHSDESSSEETPAKVKAGKKRSRDYEPKTTAANKKMRDDRNASVYFSCSGSPFGLD